MRPIRMNSVKSEYEDWREYRRIRALAMVRDGWSQSDVAAALDVTKGAVSQWVKRAKLGGAAALRAQEIPGRPARLTAEQRQQLAATLAGPAAAHGFEAWTGLSIATHISKAYGIAYHPDHAGRLARQLGRKPLRRASRAGVRSTDGSSLAR